MFSDTLLARRPEAFGAVLHTVPAYAQVISEGQCVRRTPNSLKTQAVPMFPWGRLPGILPVYLDHVLFPTLKAGRLSKPRKR